METLSQFEWPGNIRQLENVIERMILLNEGDRLTLKSIPKEISGDTPLTASASSLSSSFKEIVKETTQKIEKELILKALEERHGNVTQAAKKLGISRKSLQNKIKDYQLRSS
ncbi:MAG: helix-turn-helix domain-containing protein [Deltaproteobacteria bacterium]